MKSNTLSGLPQWAILVVMSQSQIGSATTLGELGLLPSFPLLTPAGCITAASGSIPGCQASDFGTNGCSPTCATAVVAFRANMADSCGGGLLGMIGSKISDLLSGGVQNLCTKIATPVQSAAQIAPAAVQVAPSKAPTTSKVQTEASTAASSASTSSQTQAKSPEPQAQSPSPAPQVSSDTPTTQSSTPRQPIIQATVQPQASSPPSQSLAVPAAIMSSVKSSVQIAESSAAPSSQPPSSEAPSSAAPMPTATVIALAISSSAPVSSYSPIATSSAPIPVVPVATTTAISTTLPAGQTTASIVPSVIPVAPPAVNTNAAVPAAVDTTSAQLRFSIPTLASEVPATTPLPVVPATASADTRPSILAGSAAPPASALRSMEPVSQPPAVAPATVVTQPSPVDINVAPTTATKPPVLALPPAPSTFTITTSFDPSATGLSMGVIQANAVNDPAMETTMKHNQDVVGALVGTFVAVVVIVMAGIIFYMQRRRKFLEKRDQDYVVFTKSDHPSPLEAPKRPRRSLELPYPPVPIRTFSATGEMIAPPRFPISRHHSLVSRLDDGTYLRSASPTSQYEVSPIDRSSIASDYSTWYSHHGFDMYLPRRRTAEEQKILDDQTALEEAQVTAAANAAMHRHRNQLLQRQYQPLGNSAGSLIDWSEKPLPVPSMGDVLEPLMPVLNRRSMSTIAEAMELDGEGTCIHELPGTQLWPTLPSGGYKKAWP